MSNSRLSAVRKPMLFGQSDAIPASSGRSHLRAIRPEIRRAERYAPPFAERNIINLSLNEHHAPPPQAIVNALGSLNPAALVTYDTENERKLRERIADREGVEPENVLLCPGSSAGLAQLFSSLEDGIVVFPSIVWNYYARLARVWGLHEARYDLVRRGDTFEIDTPSLLRVFDREDPALVLFIEPHMPTGAACADDLPISVAEAAPSSLVLVDEAYEGFGARPSLAPRVLDHPNLIVSKTFSKYFGLAALRVGYLVASGRIVEELSKTSSPFHMPLCSSIIALAALEAEAEYRALAVEMAETREAFRKRLLPLSGVEALSSHANFVLVELPSPSDAAAIEARLFAQGIAVRSASGYGMPNALRIGVGTNDVMAEVASAIEAQVAGR